MKILAFDYGTVRIGMAISDGLGILASGLETLVKATDKEVFAAVESILKEQEVSEIVVGLPKNMDGSYGPAAEQCKEFGRKLESQFGVPVRMWDERLSTVQAERIMISGGASRKKRRGKIDQMAARLILQNYLDYRSQSNSDG